MKNETQQASTQHTPGPWSADKWAPGWTVSAPKAQYSVCHLADCNNAEPNARLIAAAPELLEAAANAVAWLEGVCEDDLQRVDRNPATNALIGLRNAIAKAEGVI